MYSKEKTSCFVFLVDLFSFVVVHRFVYIGGRLIF